MDLANLLPLTLPIFAVAVLVKIPLVIHVLKDSKKVGQRGKLQSTYDFIIVGGGSSGAVLANRLSENPKWTVLLLEAGPEENILTKVPALATLVQFSTRDWDFRTVPQSHAAFGFEEQRVVWPRGKVIGGTSSINRMIYSRGSRHDYDRWSQLGATGWSYKDVLPYFIKSERNVSPKDIAIPLHGFKGPLIIQDVPSVSTYGSTMLEAAKYLGYPIKDYNDGETTGFRKNQMTSLDGVRQSTSTAFLKPIKRRKNLHIVTNAFVEKVIIDQYHKKASGVVVNRKKRTHFIRGKKEIILCAGAIQTPQLMMLSGIGPKKILKWHKIPVVADSPGVGQNLKDHLAIMTTFFSEESAAVTFLDSISPRSLLQYLRGKGTLASTPGDVNGYLRTKFTNPYVADIQMNPVAYALDSTIFQKSHMMTDKIFKYFQNPPSKSAISAIITVLLNPRSTGYITLASSDPYEPPLINPKYFTNYTDVQVLREGVKMALEFLKTPPYRKIKARRNNRPLPGCYHHKPWTDSFIDCYIQHLPLTYYHPIGTCRMGSDYDPYAVVDPYLRVKGVKNLRVVDASVMPTIPTGNTNAVAIMIAERAADLIKLFNY